MENMEKAKYFTDILFNGHGYLLQEKVYWWIQQAKNYGSSVKCIDWKLNKGLLLTRYDFPESIVLQGEQAIR